MSYDYRQDKIYRVERARGIRRTVPVERVLPHVHALLLQGMTPTGIATAAGIRPSTVYRVSSGERVAVRRTTARRILSVYPQGSPDRVWFGAIGTVRRIQALLALGWPHAELKARCGVSTCVLLAQKRTWVEVRTHRRILALYDELSMTLGPSALTRNRAERSGYAPPLAWDDEDIDDPTAEPNLGGPDELVRGRRPGSGTPNLHFNEVLALLEMGEAEEDVARKAGVSVKSLRRRLQRNQARVAA